MTTPEAALSVPQGTPAGTGKGRFHVLRNVLVNGLTLAGAVLFYYFVPLSQGDHPVWRLAVFIVGLGTLIFLIVRQLRKQLSAGPDPGVRVHTLITLLYPVVALFALTYYVIQRADPAQFTDLVTRTDSLYYTVITLGTVGYGDVHAVGQVARVVSMIQVAFDLVVIGALIAVATSRFQVVPVAHPARVSRRNSGSDSASPM
jgi:voltage-gated potassium channel